MLSLGDVYEAQGHGCRFFLLCGSPDRLALCAGSAAQPSQCLPSNMFKLQQGCSIFRLLCAGSAARPRPVPQGRVRERSWRRLGRSCPPWSSRCRSFQMPLSPAGPLDQHLVRSSYLHAIQVSTLTDLLCNLLRALV